MLVITGATGHYGAKVIAHLLRNGVDASQLAALVRDAAKGQALREQGVELRVGDYTDFESLVQAFREADKLLLVSSNDRGAVANRTAQHLTAIRAAQAAQVQHVVYTSFVQAPGAETSAIADFLASHAQTEQALKASDLPYTILRNGIYLEMILPFVGEQVASTGLIQFPAQNGRASWVLREELAEVAARILTTTGHENQTYALTNTEATSFADIARGLSVALGREATYQSPPLDAYQAALQQAGVPPVYIGMLSTWGSAVAQGMLAQQDNTLATLLGRQALTTAQFLAQVYKP